MRTRTRSHPRSLLSIAKSNKARSRSRPSCSSQKRIAHTSFCFNGRLAPTWRPRDLSRRVCPGPQLRGAGPVPAPDRDQGPARRYRWETQGRHRNCAGSSRRGAVQSAANDVQGNAIPRGQCQRFYFAMAPKGSETDDQEMYEAERRSSAATAFQPYLSHRVR